MLFDRIVMQNQGDDNEEHGRGMIKYEKNNINVVIYEKD